MALAAANPLLRLVLINDKMTVEEFINSEEKDLANEETKKKHLAVLEYDMQAKRTDAVLQQELKKGIESCMYSCGKCKSKQVSMYTQQTRGADEPMTEFYSCLNCGKKWKICP